MIRAAHRRRASRSVATTAVAAVVVSLTALPAAADHTFDRGMALACPADAETAFEDTGGTVHREAIDCIAFWEIVRGTGPGRYSPTRETTRGQLATYVAKLMETAGYEFDPEPEDAFDDDDGTTHEANINRLASAGVVQGDGHGNYNPGRPVTRAQMASFVAAATAAVTGTAPSSDHDHFTDDDGSAHEGSINAIASLGIVQGDGSGNYRPRANVRRAPMATFVTRAADHLAEEGHWPDLPGPIEPGVDSAYTVVPGTPENLTFGATREFSVQVPASAVLNLRLFPVADVTVEDRQAHFRDVAEPHGIADENAVSARIIAVHGTRVDAAQTITGIRPRDGLVTFVAQASDPVTVLPVVWSDAPGGTAGKLDLNDDGVPTDPYGLSVGVNEWREVAAPTGLTTPDVASFDLGARLFASTNDRTYRWQTTDTFRVNGVASNRDTFERRISEGDRLAVTYAPTGTSVFDLLQDTTATPPAPRATAFKDGAGTTANKVRLDLVLPFGNNPATGYTLQVQDVTAPLNLQRTCAGASSPSNDGWEHAAPLTPTTATTVHDPGSDGCYVYRVAVTRPHQSTPAQWSPPSNQVHRGQAIDDARPTITDARATRDNGVAQDCADAPAQANGVADACDQHRFRFDRNMDGGITEGTYRVQDADGTIADIICGTNANCSYSNASAGLPPLIPSSPATLTVDLTGNPTVRQAGEVAGLQYPLTVIDVSGHWKGSNGNLLTFTGSDRVIQVAS